MKLLFERCKCTDYFGTTKIFEYFFWPRTYFFDFDTIIINILRKTTNIAAVISPSRASAIAGVKNKVLDLQVENSIVNIVFYFLNCLTFVPLLVSLQLPILLQRLVHYYCMISLASVPSTFTLKHMLSKLTRFILNSTFLFIYLFSHRRM